MSLKVLLKDLKIYYNGAENVEKIIIDCAVVAAGAAGVAGVVPVLAIPGMIVSCVGAVWAMYIKICKELDIKIGENILKVLASAALSNIAVNLAGAFATELVLAFFPGASILASAAITFCSIYLAGVIFMKVLLALAKNGKTGDALGTISEEEFKRVFGDQSIGKEDVKMVKKVFKDNKETIKKS